MTKLLSKSQIFDIIRDVIVEELDSPSARITPDSLFYEICHDIEMDLPAIISECESGFDILISDGEMERLETIEELVETVEEKLNQ